MPEKIHVSKKEKKLEFETEEYPETEILDGKYLIRMYKTHRSATFADAINIVNNYTSYTDEHFLYVIFNEANDDLENLLSLAKAWKVFKFYIDGTEIRKDDIYQITKALFCEHKDYCEGICYQDVTIMYKGYRHWITLIKLINILQGAKDENGWSISHYLNNTPWAQKKETTKTTKYVVDKKKLLENIIKNYRVYDKYCDIFDADKLENEIQKINKEYKISHYSNIIYQSRTEPDFLEDEDFQEEVVSEKDTQYILLTEEQINQLAKKISKEMEKVLKKLMKEK